MKERERKSRKMDRLPRSVDVLGVRYRVRHAREGMGKLAGERGEKLIGLIEKGPRRIWVAVKGQDRQEPATTLLHEVIHAIGDRTGNSFKESEVEALTTGIQYVMQKNRRLAGMVMGRKST